MPWYLPVLLVLACQDPQGASAPMMAGAPPPPIPFDPPAFVRDAPTRIEVHQQALAGRTILLSGSLAGPGAGPCPPVLGGACLGLLEPQPLASGTADAAGRIVFVLPARGFGEHVQVAHLQVASPRAGAPALLSDVATVNVLFPDGDQDSDRLSNLEEARLGTDPEKSDTDGGGTSDTQEVRVDLTDPTEGADDLPGERLCWLGRDDDADGRSDCSDEDCSSTPVCPERDCADGIDGNHDGLTDCHDPTCWDEPECSETSCADGLDDDGDQYIDCLDPDCFGATCHTTRLVWGITGAAWVRRQFGFDADTADTDAGPVTYLDAESAVYHGRAWVLTPGRPTPLVCDFGLIDGRTISIDPACALDAGSIPTEFAWEASTGAFTVGGVPYLLPVSGLGPDQDTDRDEEVFRFEVHGAEPIGTCPAGGLTRSWLDRDGDGYGVSDPVDLYRQAGGLMWSCGPMPGTTPLGGDCDDGDPTWHPGNLVLAPGARCADSGTDDRDADGFRTGHDSDDRDGGVH